MADTSWCGTLSESKALAPTTAHITSSFLQANSDRAQVQLHKKYLSNPWNSFYQDLTYIISGGSVKMRYSL